MSMALDAQQIRRLLANRRYRERVLTGVRFADPSWDMLLDLAAANVEDRSVSVSSVCFASAVPPSTAMSHLVHLEALGLVARRNDPTDGRRAIVRLTDDGTARVKLWFDHFRDSVIGQALAQAELARLRKTLADIRELAA